MEAEGKKTATLKQQKRRPMSGTNMDGNWNRSAYLYEQGRDTEGQLTTFKTIRTQTKMQQRVGGIERDDARQEDKKQKQVEKSELAATVMV